MPLSGELLDELVALYGRGARWAVTPCERSARVTAASRVEEGAAYTSWWSPICTLQGSTTATLYNEDTIWKLERAEAARLLPALNALCGDGLFFTSKGCRVVFAALCCRSWKRKITIDDPDRLLLNRAPEPGGAVLSGCAPHKGLSAPTGIFVWGKTG